MARRLTLEYLLAASVDAIVLTRPGYDGLIVVRIGALGMGGDLSVERPYIINGSFYADCPNQTRILMEGQPHQPLAYRYRA